MGLNIIFYNHEHPLIQNIDKNICDSIILIIDYFGTEFFRTQEIKKLLKQGNIIIIDYTLNKEKRRNCSRIYYIASLRKHFLTQMCCNLSSIQ